MDDRNDTSTVAARAGLALVSSARAGTRWTFATSEDALHVRPSPKGGGLGLFAARRFAEGEVVLRERWLLGMPLGQAALARGCSRCLRICAFNPASGTAGVGCRAGCGAKYCGPRCEDAAWRQQHRLLCTAAKTSAPASSVNALEVFAKHARLAPSTIEQKAEDALLAAEMLATCVTWQDEGARDGALTEGSCDGSAADDEAAALRTARSALHREATMQGPARSKLPPPFATLSSYCVVSAAQRAHGSRSDKAAACARWVNDSYKLLGASPLGQHPKFRELCPPPVYSHALGALDRNAACAAAVPASQMLAARAATGAAPSAAAIEGFGLYSLFSCTNHSCRPNTVNAKGAALDGDAMLDNMLVLRACRPIAAGEEITFDYLDLAHEAQQQQQQGPRGSARTLSHAERREQLKLNFGFGCQCALCGPDASRLAPPTTSAW